MRKADANMGTGTRIGRSYRRARRAAIAAAAFAAALAAGVGTRPAGAVTATAPGTWAEAAASLFVGAAPDTLRALVADGVIERGGLVVGRVETAGVRTPPALQEATEIDGVRQVLTWIDGEGWVEDANGAVRALSGDELAACALAHALWFHTWLADSVAGFERQLDAADPAAPSITFRPRAGGPARRLRLVRDAAGDLLPARFERTEAGTPVVTTFNDWRTVAGVRFPFVSAQGTGDPRFDVVGRTTSLRVVEALPPPGIVAPVVAAAGDARLVDAASARAIPLERPGGLFLVRVEVDGRPGLGFLLDTGAGATVLAAEHAAEHGMATRGVLEARGAAGSEAAAYVDVASLRLPGVELVGQTVVSVPLAALGAALGTRVDGILGWDFLSRFAVEVDEPASVLAVFPPGDYAPRPGMARLPLRIELNVPRIEGELDGRHRGSFLLDTGNATELLLHASFAAGHGYLERARDSARALSGIGGDASIREVTVGSLALGDVRFADVEAVLAPEGSGVIALEEAVGNLGAALLRGRVLALDYRAGAAWLSGAPGIATPAAASADSASAR